jgi:hypothetical protein
VPHSGRGRVGASFGGTPEAPKPVLSHLWAAAGRPFRVRRRAFPPSWDAHGRIGLTMARTAATFPAKLSARIEADACATGAAKNDP